MDRHAAALIQWVRTRMRYLPDPDGGEFIQMPVVLLDRIRTAGFAYGDCDDHVVLLGALMASVGIQARACAVKLHGSSWYNHVVIEYTDKLGRIRLVDPCVKGGPTPEYRDRLVVR
jgi:transglutaminase-like putative cysteine protease